MIPSLLLLGYLAVVWSWIRAGSDADDVLDNNQQPGTKT